MDVIQIEPYWFDIEGPEATGQPIRKRYKCPAKDCKADSLRGDDIGKHFQKHGILEALFKATEKLSTLKKHSVGDIIEHSNQCIFRSLPAKNSYNWKKWKKEKIQ